MEFEVLYTLENEQQFWEELDDIVSVHHQSPDFIDNALRSYLAFTTEYKSQYLLSEYDFAQCSFKLLESPLFATNKDYVRTQIIFSLLQVHLRAPPSHPPLTESPHQEESADTLHMIIAFLLCDGRQNESTFGMMNEKEGFPRLLELIQEEKDDGAGLHRLVLELLYEMSRIQRLRIDDLMLIEDDFIMYLFGVIEELSNDVNDPYHYPVIRVLLILNEQYMVLAHDPGPDQSHFLHVTNRVIKFLSFRGSGYKTFGENLILLLNRENETSLQLLILKLLYLLFTTPSTYEYFYTNDLHVLVDVIIRNLLDLPHSANSLRHTYLRVLYPLLSHTQLRHPPHYKRDEILRLLAIMTSSGSVANHFGAVDETTKRLAERCAQVSWLKEADEDHLAGNMANNIVAKKLLGVEMPSAMTSSLSVVDFAAAHKEEPSVRAPRHDREGIGGLGSGREGEGDGGVGLKNGGKGDGWHGYPKPKPVEQVKSPFDVEGEA